MKKAVLLVFCVLSLAICLEGKKFSLGRSSNSRRTGYSKPAPTSVSHSQTSIPKPSHTSNAQKPSLFGWQEKSQSSGSRSSKPTQTHSYPSSNTGISGNTGRTQTQQQSQSHSYPQSSSGTGQQVPRTPQQQTNANQQSHGYPSSQGLSGSTGVKNPSQQNGGLSGAAPPAYPGHTSNTGVAGAAPPPYPGKAAQPNYGGAPPPYPGNTGYGNNPHGGGYNPSHGGGYGGYHPQGPPPPYSYGGHGYNPGPQMPGYFGNYGRGGFGGVSRGSSMLSGVGIAGAGIGTVLTGLALWNLARSTGRNHHTVIYDNRGQPVAVAPENGTASAMDSMLADLQNCSLTIEGGESREVLAIPCAIATSFSPDAHIENVTSNVDSADKTKCTITVLTKAGREYMTTIPCSVLLNTAKENNVTEPPPLPETSQINGTTVNDPVLIGDAIVGDVNPAAAVGPQAINEKGLPNCTTTELGAARDPINPCFALTTDITVLPLNVTTPTPAAA